MSKINFKNCMLVAILLTIIIGNIFVFIKLGKQDDENYKKCIENYSENYCKKSIYGIY